VQRWLRSFILSSFNPRTREGCDTHQFPRLMLGIRSFNPRTREGCDNLSPTLPGDKLYCFNPRTREGCDAPTIFIFALSTWVSIHAPARGATL